MKKLKYINKINTLTPPPDLYVLTFHSVDCWQIWCRVTTQIRDNNSSAVYVTNSMSLNVILYNSSVNKKLYFKHNIGVFAQFYPWKYYL